MPAMAECSELEPLLAAYVDGEMEPDQVGRVQGHLATCPPCRHRIAGERAARDVLQARRHGLVASAPPRLRKRCAACVCGSPAWSAGVIPRRFVRRTWIPLSFAATILLAIAGVFTWGLNGSVEALATQLALDHVKCFQFAPAHAEIDPGVAGEAWNRTYGWLINVPRSEPVEQLASAHIMYRWRGKPLSLYVLNSVPKSDARAERLVSRLGQEAIIWSDAGRTYAVIARGGREQRNDLEHIAHYVRASAK